MMNLSRTSAVAVGLAWLAAPLAARAQSAVTDLLPDVVVDTNALGQIRIDTATQPGHRLLRLSASTPNLGKGRLEIRADLTGVTDPTKPSVVLQRVYRSDGTSWDRPAGTETFDAEHAHVHFDTWAQYRLRLVDGAGGVGAVVAQSAKTSFCLLDLVPFDLGNPFIEFPGRYTGCGFLVQGISPGWADVYDLEVPGQWIDITGVPDGEYWLEAEVDPDDRVLELDESNNISCIRVQTGAPPPALPDRYENNDAPAEVDAAPVAAPSSPNLGSLSDVRRLDDLSMEDGSDVFKFHLDEAAEGGFVRVDSVFLGSDLDLVLLDGDGNILDSSTTLGNLDQISLNGDGPGDYYAWIISGDAPNPGYRLTIDPGRRQPPHITVTSPPASGIWIERAMESLPVSWIVTASASGAPTRVALAIDRDGIADKQTLRLPSYQQLDGAAGSAQVLTEGFELGAWFLYAEVSDGHGIGATWAPGLFHVYLKGDVNFDGVVDGADWRLVRQALASGPMPPGWDRILDLDRDGVLRADDILRLRRLAAEARPGACARGPAVQKEPPAQTAPWR